MNELSQTVKEEQQKKHFQFPLGYQCSVNVAKPFFVSRQRMSCVETALPIRVFQSQLQEHDTEFTFCINIFFLCCLLHDDNKKSVFTAKKKKHLNEMYVGLHRFSFMCKFRPLIVSHSVKKART